MRPVAQFAPLEEAEEDPILAPVVTLVGRKLESLPELELVLDVAYFVIPDVDEIGGVVLCLGFTRERGGSQSQRSHII